MSTPIGVASGAGANQGCLSEVGKIKSACHSRS